MYVKGRGIAWLKRNLFVNTERALKKYAVSAKGRWLIYFFRFLFVSF